MSINYGRAVSPKFAPQSEALPGQVENSAGGFVFPVSDWTRLERFLILGTEGGTYYVGERKLTKDNAAAVERCIASDGLKVVAKVLEVSNAGRAPKNDAALFVLAMCCRLGNAETKTRAYAVLPLVARIGTHLFHWAEYMKALGGLSGNGAKRAVARWYAQDAGKLAPQLVKYQRRDGWSHRDLLRLAHPRSHIARGLHGALYDWATHGWPGVGVDPHPEEALRLIWAFERAKTASGPELRKLIADYRLPHECVPNEAKSDPKTWEAMLPSMGVTALVRNLGKMTSVGFLAPLSAAAAGIGARINDVEQLKKGRVHPLAILTALKTYAQGHGDKGKLSWTPVQTIVEALNEAFYASFASVEPTGQRWFLAVDISGSMDQGQIAGMAGITPRIGAAAMALVTAATEKQHFIAGFETSLSQLDISPRERMETVIEKMQRMRMGWTDCSAPMVYAERAKMPVDTFVVLTDSETYAGGVHPHMALREYRRRTGIAAKLIVVAMTANEFTIADPSDGGMLDCVGMDASTPQVMANFSR